jgi:hypothetical protein
MSRHASWRLLPASAPGIPTLLVSATFADDSYTVHLSDLANLWVETMDRRPIIKRGMLEDTSIDPSDGPDQIRKMMELIRAAFDSSDPDHDTTSLALSRGNEADSLAITVTCVLPEPLKPFRWPMQFKKCPPSSLASELVLPMIQAQEARVREVEQLVSLIKDKDNVIAKLVQKLESTGIGLEHVFHALAGKRKVSRAAAEGRVKGIAPFSEADFRRKVEMGSIAQPADVTTLLGSVFGDSGLRYKSELDLEASSALNDWWTKLVKGATVRLTERLERSAAQKKTPTPSQPETAKEDDFQVQSTPPRADKAQQKRASPPPPADDEETASDDDFQVQATPPKGRQARKRPSPPPHPAKDDETASEDDFQVQKTPPRAQHTRKRPSPSPPKTQEETASEDDFQVQKTPPRAQHARKRPSPHRPVDQEETASENDDATASSEKPRPTPPKLGAIGRKGASPPPPPSHKSGTSRTVAQDSGSETASDADEDDLETRPPPPKPAATRGGLGRIGGRPKEAPLAPAPDRSPSPSAPSPAKPTAASPLPRRHKLGVIGKTGASTSAAASDASSTRDDGRSRSRTPATEPPAKPPARETSQERAERRRAELQRELDRRAAAGPAKKKRKF